MPRRVRQSTRSPSKQGGPKGAVAIRILRPKGAGQPLPAVVYTHGAGWVFGDKDIYDRLLRDLAHGAKAAVVMVDFTRSPEARYPVAIEESYAVVKYVAENGKTLGLDPSRLAVAGDSVGGNMTAAVTMLAKERRAPKIGLQVLFYPVTDARFDTPSYQQFPTGHFLTREAMKWFWNQYLPDEAARKQPTASPLQATVEQLKGLPPALVINGEFDVLRDEGEAYAHKLIEAGALQHRRAHHGWVVLLVDSFGPRGVREICTSRTRPVEPGRERARDAYGALVYLQQQNFVRADRIALLGWSNGGSTVLWTIGTDSHARPAGLAHDFRAAVAFYPGVPRRARVALVGHADPAPDAGRREGRLDTGRPLRRSRLARAKHAGPAVEIVTYPAAFHYFDAPDVPLRVRQNIASTKSGTATIGTDPVARADTIQRVPAYLAARLAP